MISLVSIDGHLYEVETNEQGVVIRTEARDPKPTFSSEPDKVEALNLAMLDPSLITSKQLARAVQLLLKQLFKMQ